MNPKHGGPCQGIRNSIPALQYLGADNEVVCLDEPNEEFIKKDNFVIHALGASKGGWAYNKDLKFWLAQNFEKYDVLIVHGIWSYHSYAAVKSIIKNRKDKKIPKLFVMPHGMLDPWFQRDKSRKLKALRNELYWRLIEKKVVNCADGLLFTCEQEMLLARETFKGYKPKQELNIGYGIQPPPTYTSEMRPALNKPYLLFLSRLHPKKGVDLLIDAYKKLESTQENIPDLVFAGPKEDSYAHQMMLLAKPSKRIHFVGMLQGNAKWGALYGCAGFILPSHQENFGIAVVEAMACSKPVLISNQVNIWREIANGKGGHVESDTLDGVYDLLNKFLQKSNEEQLNMGAKAKETYQKHFAIEMAAKKMVAALEDSEK